eukprot:Hpha_TRINITY_DN14941_c2_g1::TRINITY_DN14941_c2_g1_i1::g.143506::m.143506
MGEAPPLVELEAWPNAAPPPPEDDDSPDDEVPIPPLEGMCCLGRSGFGSADFARTEGPPVPLQFRSADFARALGDSSDQVELQGDDLAEEENAPPPLLSAPECFDHPNALPTTPAVLNVREVLEGLAAHRGATRVAEEALEWAQNILRGRPRPLIQPAPAGSSLCGVSAAGTPHTPDSTVSPSPAFEHRGRLYPAGLNRKQRRAIRFGTAKERERLSCPSGEIAECSASSPGGMDGIDDCTPPPPPPPP